MEKDRTGLYTKPNSDEAWIETYTGKFVNPLNLKPEDIEIADIIHALSLICRFNGHCRRFYSVAEHSLRVAGVIYHEPHTDKDFLAGLLHDASEAYLSDITRPVKYSLPIIKAIESKITYVINEKYGILNANWKLVKYADNVMLAEEAFRLMRSKGKEWYLPEGRPKDSNEGSVFTNLGHGSFGITKAFTRALYQYGIEVNPY